MNGFELYLIDIINDIKTTLFIGGLTTLIIGLICKFNCKNYRYDNKNKLAIIFGIICIIIGILIPDANILSIILE